MSTPTSAPKIQPREWNCRILEVRPLTPTVFELIFEAVHHDSPFHFLPGQFLSVVVPGKGPQGRDLRRAYSIAAAPGERHLRLCIKKVEEGPGTTYLEQLKAGDSLKVHAPYGSFFYRTSPQSHVCFIATGTGISPFRSMVCSELFRAAPPRSSACLLGVRQEDEVLYADVFSSIPGLQWRPIVSQPTLAWKGLRGRVTDDLKAQHPALPPLLETEYYLCGNGGMIAEVKQWLLDQGVAKEKIHQEIYYK